MRVATISVVLVAALLPAGSVYGNLIFNGNFEAGKVGFTTGYTWSTDLCVPGTIAVVNNPHNWCPRAMSYGDNTHGDGLMLMANGATGTSVTVWEQTVSVVPGTRYVFCYWISSWTDDAVRMAELDCQINGVHVGLGMGPKVGGEWGFVFHRWDSGANTSATIRLINLDRAEVSNDFALDDICMMEIGDNYFMVVSATRGGTVVSPGRGVFIHPPGDVVDLEARCDCGYEFVGWIGSYSDANHDAQIGMDNDYIVKATFKKLDHDVTIRASGSAPDEFTLCDEFTDGLQVRCDALASDWSKGMIVGNRKGACDATYRFPIFKPAEGAGGIERIALNLYGSLISYGPVVRVGDLSPLRPQHGELHTTLTGNALRALLRESDEPVYWVAVKVDAIMGVWDLAGVYVSYDCPGIPRNLLQSFHDSFAVYQALDSYARDPSIRDLFRLKAGSPRAWEAVGQTVARTEDIVDGGSALQEVAGAAVEAFDDTLALWQPLGNVSKVTGLAGCGTQLVVTGLDLAALSGKTYVLACADAIADGRVSPEEAEDLSQLMADWQADLTALQTAMSNAFLRLGDVYHSAQVQQNRQLRNTAEQALRALGPWCTGEPDEFGFWTPTHPTYLEEVIRNLVALAAE